MSWSKISTTIDKLRDFGVHVEMLVLWMRKLRWLAAFLIILVLGIHLTVHFVIWPKVQNNKSQLELALSKNLNVQVQIDSISTQWDFIWPSFDIKNVRIVDPIEPNNQVLTIPQVSGNLSWESLWHFKPYFNNLKFNNANIQVKRDSAGNWNIAGIKLRKENAGYAFGDWILDQDSIEISQAKIIWFDQFKQSTQHTIQINELKLNNSWFTHQAHLNFESPWHSGPANVDAQFRHGLFSHAGNWENWSGKFEWQINQLQIAQVSPLLNNSPHIAKGEINTNGKAYLNDGILNGANAQIIANNLYFESPRFDKAIKINFLETKIEEDTQGEKMIVSAPLLRWRSNDKTTTDELNDLSFYWDIAPNIESIKQAGIKAKHIDVALLEDLTKQFPLPQDLREFIRNYQPSGQLENLDANWNANRSKLPFRINIPGFNESQYKLSFEFDNLSLKSTQTKDISLSNIKGKLFVTEFGGEAYLDSGKSAYHFPQILENDDLKLDQAEGLIKWSKKDHSWAYELKNMHLSNNDADIEFDAAYTPAHAKNSEQLFIQGKINRANVKGITAYFPLGMSKNARDYIRGALLGGQIKNGRIQVNGDPNKIPYAQKNSGTFNLELPIVNVDYLPAPETKKGKSQWSAFSKVGGTVSFKGPELNLNLDQASYESVQLSKIKGQVQDISNSKALLHISGQASGLAQDLFDYFAKSPTGEKIGFQSHPIKIDGVAKLQLNINLPLANADKTQLEGELELNNNQLNINNQIEAKEMNGSIFFSEEKIIAKKFKADVWGGTITADTNTQLPWQKEQTMKITGHAKVDQLMNLFRDESSEDKFSKQINGNINYNGQLSITSNGYKLNLDTGLNDITSNLPPPFNKKSGEQLSGQLKLESIRKESATEHSGIITVGKLIDARYIKKSNESLRLGIGINTVGIIPNKGISSNINLAQLDLKPWQDWSDKTSQEANSSKLKKNSSNYLDSFTASIGLLKFADKEFKNVSLSANHEQDLWKGNLNSSFATGLVQWKAAEPGLPNGKITAKLEKLVIESSSAEDTPAKTLNDRIQKIPALDIQSESVTLNGKPYGHMDLLASNDKNDWKIEKLVLTTPDAKLQASGRWLTSKQGKQTNIGKTELNFDLAIQNAGQLLKSLGYPSAIEAGAGKLNGNISWTGEPHKFDIASLQGDLNLDLNKGTVLQVDPGVARLLGVLSFQGLNRIATLDIGGVLAPIVTKGTPFDKITSKGTINNGIAQIQDLTMKGPQGNIKLSGNANLINETQDIRITVLPAFNAGSASLAYTFINPIIGLSTLVGQYLISDEVSKLFQMDYLVQGTWANPQIIALDNKGKPLNAEQLKEIRDKSLLRQQQNQIKK